VSLLITSILKKSIIVHLKRKFFFQKYEVVNTRLKTFKKFIIITVNKVEVEQSCLRAEMKR